MEGIIEKLRHLSSLHHTPAVHHDHVVAVLRNDAQVMGNQHGGGVHLFAQLTDEGEDLLVPIEDDETFDEIAEIFEERLSEYYEINEEPAPLS